MSCKVVGNIGFSTLGGEGIAFVNMDRYAALGGDYSSTTKSPGETKPDDINTPTEYVPWGDDNLMAVKMVQDIESCGVLSGGIDGKARFGIGRGIKPFKLTGYAPEMSEILAPLEADEIEEWMDDNVAYDSCFGWFKDMIGMGQTVARFKFSNDGKSIGYCTRHDVSEMRYEPKNKDGVIEHILLSAQWNSGTTPKDLIKLPLIPRLGASNYLESLTPEKRAGKEFAMVVRLPGWNRHYYSMALWYSARLWVEISKAVPVMKAAMFENNIRLKYVVIIHEEYWTRTFDDWEDFDAPTKEGHQKALYDEIEKFLTGAKNAYKSIFVEGHTDPIHKERWPDIEIKPVEDNTKPGELLPDSAAGNSEILFSLMMNPALMGADTPGGPYSGGAGSGSNIREAAWVQVMIQEYERYSVTRFFTLTSRINGWKKKYPQLVWRWPGLELTTLDTGGSAKEIVTGSAK